MNNKEKSCSYCDSQISILAKKCPNCGEFLTRSVGILLFIGIAILPIFFSWFTLRKGHSDLSRVLSFGWLILCLYASFSGSGVKALNNQINELESVSLDSSVSQNDSSPRSWVEVASWEGSGQKNTETFETESSEWRINLKTKNPEHTSIVLIVMVYDQSGGLVGNASIGELGTETSYIRSAPGRHYLDISSSNTKWEVKVEDKR